MKCYKCRTEVSAGAKFCSKCGAEQGFSEELMKRAADGEQEAVTELYSRTYNNAYFTVKALIKDEDTVLDIIQDSYVKAFKNLNQLKEADKFRAWIKRICHNQAVDYLRKTKPVMFSVLSADEERAIEFEDDRVENLPEEVMDQKETSRLIQEILNSLSDEQRLVVGMFYYEQFSVREIAKTLGVSENTVKSRLNYARKKIEERIVRLEKEQGIRLHGLAPIPFLLWLFKSQDVQAAEIPRLETFSSLQEECVRYSSKSLSASSGKAPEALKTGLKTGTEASKAVKSGTIAAKTAAAAGKGLAAKMIAGVAAAAVLGGGAAAVYKSVNHNQPAKAVQTEAAETETAEGEAIEIKDTIFSRAGFDHYALIEGELTCLMVMGDREKFGYMLRNDSEEAVVMEEDYEMGGSFVRLKNAEVVQVEDKLLFTGEGLNGEQLEDVPFYINGSEEAQRLIAEAEQMREENAPLEAFDFAGYYTSTDTSLSIGIVYIDETTADIYIDRIAPNELNAFNLEKQAYLEGESLIMDMETSEGDRITFTLEDGKLIVHASEHYEAKADTRISGTYTLYDDNDSVNENANENNGEIDTSLLGTYSEVEDGIEYHITIGYDDGVFFGEMGNSADGYRVTYYDRLWMEGSTIMAEYTVSNAGYSSTHLDQFIANSDNSMTYISGVDGDMFTNVTYPKNNS